MSALRLLFTSACRQYTCLTLNKLAVPVAVQRQPFHSSQFVKSDVSDIIDSVEDKPKTRRTAEVKQKKIFTDAPYEVDYIPGGEYIPTVDIYEHLVDGVRYDELPRVYIKSTSNNTIASAHANGQCITIQSGGKVGFKHCKKKSNVCGQTVGLAIGMDLLKKGHKNVCVLLRGHGAGRLPAVKGIQLAGVNVIALTDNTYPNVTQRPRKAKRL